MAQTKQSMHCRNLVSSIKCICCLIAKSTCSYSKITALIFQAPQINLRIKVLHGPVLC